MTRLELLDFLVKEAKLYRKKSFKSIRRSNHMNNLSQKDFSRLKKNRLLNQKIIDALLVDFINFIGAGQCLDYGLYTKDLK